MTIRQLSLVQRLWLLLLLLVTFSIGGALVANLLNARSYLEQQLTAQSADTANSLALMLTQYKADPVMAQTLLNAAFEQGHFAEVRWDNVHGQPAVQLQNRNGSEDTPTWFHRLLPLAPQPGVAQVTNGWLQAGHITVTAHLGYAYSSLWQGALQTVGWLIAIGLIAGVLGFVDLRQLRRQLGAVVEQAQAISEQRFVRIPIPHLPELAEVARAMNHMVERLQNYLIGLRDEVERLRQEILTDSNTGLPNRKAFDQHFTSLLTKQEDPLSGHLLLIRVTGLAELNQRLGGRKTDALLQRLADDLLGYCQSHRGWLATRLRGADFALLCPELPRAEACTLAEELCQRWPHYWSMELTDQSGIGHIAITPFESGDKLEQVLARANNTLTLAEAQPLNSWKLDDDSGTAASPASDLDWRQLIESSCRDNSLQLRWYPVCDPNKSTLWREGMLFRPPTPVTPQMSALRLVSHALRLGLVHELDLNTLALALKHGPAGTLAVNMSSASLRHPDFLPTVQRLLQEHPGRCIHFEFHEIGLEEQWDAFVAFSRAVRLAGHQVAVEIQGHNLALVARMHEAGIAYLVLDSALTEGVHVDEGRSALLRGLLQMATLMGIQLEAKGIKHSQDAAALIDLGVHCLTGPAIG